MNTIEQEFTAAYHKCLQFMNADKTLAKASTFVMQNSPVLTVTFDSTCMTGYSGFRAFIVHHFGELICGGLKGKTIVFDETATATFGRIQVRLV